MKKAILIGAAVAIVAAVCANSENYIDTKSNDFINNYVDMRSVTDFELTETGIILYTGDGSGYYWER